MEQSKRSSQVLRLTYSALYLAIAMVLPFLTGQIPEIGSMLCPMHIPVLLCGFVCGWAHGLLVGLVAPLLRFLFFGMPPLYPTAIAMSAELAVYGAVSGVLFRLLPRKPWAVFAALLGAMAAGRVVWGLAQYALLQLRGELFSGAMFVAGAITSAIPGIILHILLIPAIVIALDKAGLVFNPQRKSA